MTHFAIMAIFAGCVSIVFGTLLRVEPREQLRLGLCIFGALVVGAVAVGWLMLLFR